MTGRQDQGGRGRSADTRRRLNWWELDVSACTIYSLKHIGIAREIVATYSERQQQRRAGSQPPRRHEMSDSTGL
jgi:hypothetical protein